MNMLNHFSETLWFEILVHKHSTKLMASREADFQLPWSIDSLAEDAKKSRKKCIVFKQKPILSQAKPNIDPVTGTWPEMSWHSFKPDVTLLVSH